MGKGRKISFFQGFMIALNIALALGLILSYVSIYINPERFWGIAFFGLAYPFFFLLNFLFLLFWMFSYRRAMWISLLVLAAGWKFHLDVIHFNFKDSSMVKEDSSLKIMTYNVHEFRRFDENKDNKVTKRKMLQVILAEKPAIICFQEYYSKKKGEFDITDTLFKQLKFRDYYFEKVKETDFGSFGIALFSRWPIINKKFIQLTEYKSDNSALVCDIVRGKDTIRVINVHFQSINFQPEDYQYLEMLKKEMDADKNSSRRIGGRLKKAFIKRSRQALLIEKEIEKSPYPLIVCGDFNDTPISFTFHTVSKHLKNTFREKGSGFGITYGGAFPNFQIDYILCDKKMEVADYHMVKKKLSDHYPVVSTLIFPPRKNTEDKE